MLKQILLGYLPGYDKKAPLIICLVSVLFVMSAFGEQDSMKWTHFSIADSLPGSGWGTGGTALADFDGDGDLDAALSRRETLTAYWFERVNDSTWVRHAMGGSEYLARALGATAIDLDRDGHVDAVINNLWFKNPGNLDREPDAAWRITKYDGGGHDIVAGDIDQDGYLDLINYHGIEVAWFDYSKNMKKTIIGEGEKNHGGTAPKGIGDLNGDGYQDVVIPAYWFENPGLSNGAWKRHAWPHTPIPHATYGTSIRAWVVDLNKDGENDIVYSDCDTGFSHVYWLENQGRGAGWTVHLLPDPPTPPGGVAGTGSFHSLGVADFDGDGDLDIFAGEQEDATMTGLDPLLPMKTPGLKERGVIWVNSSSTNPSFKCVLIHVDNPGWHDAVLGDVDGDGDMDIVSKIWNKDGSYYHADYWRNDTGTGNKP
jgi:FG-GAP-like repeat